MEDIEEVETKHSQPESELLPGPKGQPLYYDGIGYYYNQTNEDDSLRILQCSHSACGAQAQMELFRGAPITLMPTSEGHSHQLSAARRERIRFLYTIKERHNSEETPFHLIFQGEAKRNPLGASFFSFEKIEKHLKKKASQRLTTSDTELNKDKTPKRETSLPFFKTKSKGNKEFQTAKKRKIDDTSQPAENLTEILKLLKNALQNIVPIETEPLVSSSTDSRPSDFMLTDLKLDDSSPTVSKQIDCRPSSSGHLVIQESGRSKEKYSEKLSGPEFFHNFKGHYFFSISVKNGERKLRCLAPTCAAKARMTLEENAEIQPEAGSRPHNHKPDLTTNYNDKISQMESDWSELMPSERLPSLRHQYCCYHDDKGFYYYQSSVKDNIRFLMCIESSCPARAHMSTHKCSPITISPMRPPHNHSADFSLRDALLFIDAVRVRVRSGIAHQSAIEEEKQRNLIGANRIDLNKLLICLRKETEVDFNSSLKLLNAVQPTSDLTIVKNHYNETSDTVPLCHFESTPQDPTFCDEEDLRFTQTNVRKGIREQIALSHINKEVEPSKRPYRQRQIPELTINTDDCVNSNDMAEVDEETGDSNEDQQNYPLKPAEVIPGLRPDANNYHDGNGFYYKLNRIGNCIRYLKCLTKNCHARAYMNITEKNAPIIQTNFANHNHGPDLLRKQFTVFLHRMTRRAAEENTPINIIYQEEAARDPVSASKIRLENVKQRMVRYRRKHRATVSNDFL